MLEDDFTYVLRKALKGLALAPAEAARKAGLPEREVLEFSKGKFSEPIARGLAEALELRGEAFARHADYEPKPLAQEGVRHLLLPFSEDTVNAWLIADGERTFLFDTGNDPSSCLKALGKQRPSRVFITHGHHDHVGGIAAFAALGIPIDGPESVGTEPIEPGDFVTGGSLLITAIELSGHAKPALGYLINGLGTPVLVTGDALFAGSLGGCNSTESYQLALHTLRDALAPLPDSTVLLPGHGPATTLGEERARNPFPVF